MEVGWRVERTRDGKGKRRLMPVIDNVVCVQAKQESTQLRSGQSGGRGSPDERREERRTTEEATSQRQRGDGAERG